jgi:hypothetical protein
MSLALVQDLRIAIGHPIWALETGVIYNAKDFETGRQLIVGVHLITEVSNSKP